MNKQSSWAAQSTHNKIILDFWSEYIGILVDVTNEDIDLILHFSNSDFIILPLMGYFKKRVCNFKGYKISVLATDLKNKPYIIRREDPIFKQKNKIVLKAPIS